VHAGMRIGQELDATPGQGVSINQRAEWTRKARQSDVNRTLNGLTCCAGYMDIYPPRPPVTRGVINLHAL